uniref:RRM domain-containing protein n=1 Tax=Nannochloropsis gaditana (strain CCMP526) TaxID=1093141 RepID=I2CRH6_NANGC
MDPKPKPKADKSIVYVGGLDEQCTEEMLHAAFIPFGDIVEVNIPKDFKENTTRGFGFVHFESAEDAAAAIDNMEGAELLGRVLKCNVARPMQHKLGANKPVWSTDEWFKSQLAEDKDLGDQLEYEELVPEAVGE